MDDELKELVTRLYKEKGVDVEPTYPRVMVRVLPREQTSRGGIVLPEFKQNKPNLEGIVLAVYKPFWKTLVTSSRSEWDRKRSKIQIEVLDGTKVEKNVIRVEALVSVGDHVIFPHMEVGITPVWPLDGGIGEYRLVPDDQISAVLKYEKESTRDWLIKTLDLSEDLGAGVADNLLAHAQVTPTDLPSKTLSGR